MTRDHSHNRPSAELIRWALLACVLLPTVSAATLAAEPVGAGNGEADPGAVEFFEKSVRPILAARCHECHGPAKQKGGLRLDARSALIAGGSTGPAVVPGNPEASLLVDAINYGDTYQMPPKSKLPNGEIQILTEWVKRGAPWGVATPEGAATAGPTGKSDLISKDVFARRSQHWSFRPIRRSSPPATNTAGAGWARNPIDVFIQAALSTHGLSPAPEASKRTLIRRLSFDLTGLPPTREELAAYLADSAPDAYDRLVDRVLSSPRYGERWGRHWLDLVRYAETAGHEFDYDIVGAFRYRDYVIRAFNADLPFHQFVIEQLAGDLLDAPRRHPGDGINESVLGTGFYFLGEGTHSPVDVREEQMRRVDNQIDVLSKAFLGLTVACARCHDHKFDPITNKDYYALAGFLRSSRHQQAPIDDPGRAALELGRLQDIKKKLGGLLGEAIGTPWQVGRAPGAAPPVRSSPDDTVFDDFNRDSFDGWFNTGQAFGDRPSQRGDFRLDFAGGASRAVPIRPGQAHSGVISDRLRGVMRSRSFTIESRYIHWLVAGRGGRINVVVDGFEKIRDPIYGALTQRIDVGDVSRWVTQDVGMWLGHSAYLEIGDGGTVDFDGVNTQIDDGAGYVAVDEIRMSNQAAPAAANPAALASFDLGPLQQELKRAGRASLALKLAAAVEQARAIEARFVEPAMALAIADGSPENEHLQIRGSHKNLGELVPRRFLEVLGGAGATNHIAGSGRLELARAIVDPASDPLLPRVIVNRLWKHHFGEGIVKTTDDFGAMGRPPTHPELLDWLAAELIRRDWSQKAMHRLMVTSSTYRMESNLQGDAERLDPTNAFLHRMNVRRIEAEAIRDSLLAVSGRLDSTMFGPSVPVHLNSFMEGRGRPRNSGPLDGAGRRSLYIKVNRNFLDPMFLAFDMPVPFSTMGRRNVSNVPAQALTLMNDPLVVGQARLCARNILTIPGQSDRARLDCLYETAFSRPPTDKEVRACLAFLDSRRQGCGDGPKQGDDRETTAWADLAHVLVNMKEFIFVE